MGGLAASDAVGGKTPFGWFGRKWLRCLSAAQLREKLALSIDDVILSTPPRDATGRTSYCAHGDRHMWRSQGEAGLEKLAGQDPYPQQRASIGAAFCKGGSALTRSTKPGSCCMVPDDG